MSDDSEESKPDPAPLKHRLLRFGTAFLLFAALMFSWLWTPTYINRTIIARSRAKYVPEKFLVTGAQYDRGSGEDSMTTWWLTGKVRGHEERLVPYFGKPYEPTSASDLLGKFPEGSTVDVFYNPEATDMLIQGESLRALQARPNLWQWEDELRRKLAWRVLVPVPLALCLFSGVRVWLRFYAKPPRDVISSGRVTST